MNNNQSLEKLNAIRLLTHAYDAIEPVTRGIDFITRVEQAKKIASNDIINQCQCKRCLDTAYEILIIDLSYED